MIYNAAGVPVAVYDNHPNGSKLEKGYPRHEYRLNNAEDRGFNSTDNTKKSDSIGKGNFRLINPTREEALFVLEQKNQMS